MLVDDVSFCDLHKFKFNGFVLGWWYKPEYIINELNINSVITTPCHEEILPINAFTTQRPYTLKGYAYSGTCPFNILI